MGAELDSLADMVSFGIAPAFLSMRLIGDLFNNPTLSADGKIPFAALPGPFSDDLWLRLFWVIGATYVCCTALRLARFNVITQHDVLSHMNFRGMPSPGAAAVVAATVIFFESLRPVGAYLAAHSLSIAGRVAGGFPLSAAGGAVGGGIADGFAIFVHAFDQPFFARAQAIWKAGRAAVSGDDHCLGAAGVGGGRDLHLCLVGPGFVDLSQAHGPCGYQAMTARDVPVSSTISRLPQPAETYFVQQLLAMGRAIRTAIITGITFSSVGDPARVNRVSSADTIYEIDAHVDETIERFCAQWGKEFPFVLIAEGITGDDGTDGKAVFPRGTRESDARFRIICDPIDGTRGLMYDKRAAWFLAGVAPNRGAATRLSDIEAAVQVEIPTSKQYEADLLWAVKGKGAHGIRESVRGGVGQMPRDISLRPSQAGNIDHGFAAIANFFPDTKELAGRLMERIAQACLGVESRGRGVVFDDQYISTGGQFYELIVGHDRFNADLRPLFYQMRGLSPGLCVHPYDAASVLIALEAGVLITDGLGNPLDGPLDVTTPLSWAGFANAELRGRIEPVMLRILREWLAAVG